MISDLLFIVLINQGEDCYAEPHFLPLLVTLILFFGVAFLVAYFYRFKSKKDVGKFIISYSLLSMLIIGYIFFYRLGFEYFETGLNLIYFMISILIIGITFIVLFRDDLK